MATLATITIRNNPNIRNTSIPAIGESCAWSCIMVPLTYRAFAPRSATTQTKDPTNPRIAAKTIPKGLFTPNVA